MTDAAIRAGFVREFGDVDKDADLLERFSPMRDGNDCGQERVPAEVDREGHRYSEHSQMKTYVAIAQSTS